MYQLTEKELRQVQLIQLEMLVEVRRICDKLKIKYSIIAGTLLGAVRHEGFIPWDDDADIAMLRKEYIRFREACKTELDHTRFYFQDCMTTKGYRWGYGKLRRKNTLFLREGQDHMPYEQGIFIDIFPMDYVSDHREVRAIQNAAGFVIRKIMWSKVGSKIEKNYIKRTIYGVMEKIPEETMIHLYERYVSLCNRKETKWTRILTYPTPNKQYGYLTKWYKQGKTYSFEKELFNGIKADHQYLKFKYGDYRKLPEQEDRKVHPVSKIKLVWGKNE